MSEKKYYWWKQREDFFNQKEIRLLLSEENGAEYCVFWQKLICLSIKDSEPGLVRFNESLPYTNSMLANVTSTNENIVTNALILFEKYGMIQKQENGHIWLNGIEDLVGSETDSAIRKRESRKKKKPGEGQESFPDVTMSGQCHTEVEKEVEKEIEKEIGTYTEFYEKLKEIRLKRRGSYYYGKLGDLDEIDIQRLRSGILRKYGEEEVLKAYEEYMSQTTPRLEEMEHSFKVFLSQLGEWVEKAS